MNTSSIPRGATILFTTTFYDVDDEVTQPNGAIINIVYPDADGVEQTTQITMSAPAGSAVAWTAEWDTREVGPGIVFFSIHTVTTGSPPFGVEDGRFNITANAANLPTF